MNLLLHSPVLFWAIIVNYLLVIYCLYHLIFKSAYSMKQRLNWMTLLWLLPILGPLAYWLYSRRG